jgi:hypothetical protein
MSNGTPTGATGPVNVRIEGDFANIPVLFADGAMSQAFGPGISKFYLYRSDFDPNLSLPNKNTPIVQIVMHAEGFARMIHFFQHRLRIMVDAGVISQQVVDQINRTEYPTTNVG